MVGIFIYGSCTTRDSVPYWAPHGLRLDGYLARQSLVSAYQPVSPRHIDTTGISSSFQRRMMKRDAKGTAVLEIREALSRGNWIVWDLTDERGGVHSLASGGMLTKVAHRNVNNSCTANILSSMALESEEFCELWISSAKRLAIDLGDDRRRVIINCTHWSERYEDGELGPASSPSATVFNAQQRWMVDALRDLGFQVSVTPIESTFAARSHQWGPAAFHYAEETYRAMTRSIASVIEL